MKERIEVIRDVTSEWAPMMKGLDFDMDAAKRFYRELAMDIKTQKERIGGDWAVAHVVYIREIRDMIRWVISKKRMNFLNRHTFTEILLDLSSCSLI